MRYEQRRPHARPQKPSEPPAGHREEDTPLLPAQQQAPLLPRRTPTPLLVDASGEGVPSTAPGGADPPGGTGAAEGEEELSSMEEMLARIEHAVSPNDGHVTLDAILDHVGRRSFGPLLLLAGLVTLAPVLGDIPGVPTLMGLLVLITAGQLLLRRDHFWLPRWLLKRSISRKALCKGLKWMRKPARFLDRLLSPRLTWMVKGPGLGLIALICFMIGLMLPPMEFVPFSANGAGVALTIFGLSLVAKDGLAALIGIGVTAGTATLVTMGLL